MKSAHGLVDLNKQRTGEESRGLIRWLRPDYQIDKFGALAHRADRVQEIGVSSQSRGKLEFPQAPKDQAGQILQLLRRSVTPLTPEQVAAAFKEGEQILVDVRDILQSFNRLGDADSVDNGRSFFVQSA